MNKKGWISPRGSFWSQQTIKYILSNPTYAGKVWWGWRHSDYRKTREWKRIGRMGYIGAGEHEPIVSESLVSLVYKIKERRAKQACGGTGRSFGLLTGIAKCIRCKSGVGYHRRLHKRSNQNPSWKDSITFEYICTGYKYKGICSQRVMSATKLENAILDHIRNIYSQPKVQEKVISTDFSDDQQHTKDEIYELEKEIQLASQKEVRHKEAFERGLESIEELEGNISRIREEVKKNRMVLDNLISVSTNTLNKQVIMEQFMSSMTNFDSFWTKIELDEKKMILRSIIKEIRAGDGKVEIDFIF